MDYCQGQYFYKEIFKDIYLIGCKFYQETIESSWYEMQDKYQFGPPTGNSWLIKGENMAILIDSAAPVRGLRQFVEELVNVPIMFVLSHAHYDHIFCLDEFNEFWMHENDIPLLYGALGFPKYPSVPKNVHYLKDGDIIDLGNKKIKVYQIEGHTNGSLLLLDQESKVLFSGDSIARRLLLFDVNNQKIKNYFYKINEIRNEDFDYICTCHDRVPLHKEYIDFIFKNLVEMKDIQSTRKLFNGNFGDFYTLKIGNERTESYLNCSIVSKYRDVLVETVKEINSRDKEKNL